MKLYIAGPMSGLPNYNFAAFDQMRDALLDKGHTCISPADMDRDIGFDGTTLIPDDQRDSFTRDAVLRNVYALAKCGVEGIILLPGWEKSKGTAVEIAVAELLGLKILKPCHHTQDKNGDRFHYHNLDHMEVIFLNICKETV